MKKLLTIAVAVMCAALAQASTVTWLYGGDIMDNADTEYATGSAWVIYLGSGTDVSAITVDDTGAISAGDNTVVASASVNDGLFNDGDGLMTTATDNGNYVLFAAYKGSDNNWYYGNTDVQSVSGLTDDPTTMAEVNFGNSPLSLSTQAVPEPTSVALLVLGLAAIGMKRKVA